MGQRKMRRSVIRNAGRVGGEREREGPEDSRSQPGEMTAEFEEE